MTDVQMNKAPDKIGFYCEPVNDEPAEVVWIDYITFLTTITAPVGGDPYDNARRFDRNISSMFAKIVNATTLL